MIRTIAVFASLFLLGPSLAFATVWFGCLGSEPLLGVYCGHNGYLSLFGFTLIYWLLTVVAMAARPMAKWQNNRN